MGLDYRKELERKKGRREQLQQDLEQVENQVKVLGKHSLYCEEAQVIIQDVAQQTQAQLEYHISELVTLAMSAVFEDPYELKVEFVLRRNRTECDIWFKRGENFINPMMASGGGAVDVAAFALRVALWSLARPKTNNILILDEPMRFLSKTLQPQASAVIKEISERLGIQIIYVTHSEDLVEAADKVITVKQIKGVSQANSPESIFIIPKSKGGISKFI